MRFAIVYYGMEPKNRGIDQLAQILRQLSHDVTIVCRTRKTGAAVSEFHGAPVKQLPGSPSVLNYVLSFPLPLNFLWTRWLYRLARKQRWDGIFVRETPLANHAQAAGKKLGIPVFLDMRENFSMMYTASGKDRWFRKFTRPVFLLKKYEKKVLPRFSHVFTVTQELGQWMRRAYPMKDTPSSTLSNYPSSLFLIQAKQALESKEQNTPSRAVTLIHAGLNTVDRGLQDILKALKILVQRKRNVLLRIIGDGPYTPELKNQTQYLGLQDSVQFIPLLPPGQLAAALVQADIGLCSYQLREMTHQTLPGKLFEYMATGLPVLTSARKPVVRIVEKEKCGIVYPSAQPEVIAGALQEMIDNPQEMRRMGERGRRAILSQYNQESNIGRVKEVLDRHLKHAPDSLKHA